MALAVIHACRVRRRAAPRAAAPSVKHVSANRLAGFGKLEAAPPAEVERKEKGVVGMGTGADI